MVPIEIKMLFCNFLFFYVKNYRAPIQIIFPAQFWVAGTVKTNVAELTGKRWGKDEATKGYSV